MFVVPIIKDPSSALIPSSLFKNSDLVILESLVRESMSSKTKTEGASSLTFLKMSSKTSESKSLEIEARKNETLSLYVSFIF